jgi:hypothetical protein
MKGHGSHPVVCEEIIWRQKKMNKNIIVSGILLLVLSLLTACASSDSGVQGKTYPPTDKVEPVFLKSQIPDSCRVFAHLFVTMPAGYTGQDFVKEVSAEAKSKGADMILIGQSRQCTTDTELKFTYYGPDREYRISEWPGWNFGFEEWEEQGEWAGIGYQEWGNSSVRFDYPIDMQVVFLRCR